MRDDVRVERLQDITEISIHVPRMRDDCKTNKFNGTILIKA